VSTLSSTTVFVIHYLFSLGNINDEKVQEKDEEKVEGKSKGK
jgi:hypothetical protein